MYRFVFSTLKNFKSSVLKMFYYMITRVRARQKFADKKWRETCPPGAREYKDIYFIYFKSRLPDQKSRFVISLFLCTV